MQNKNNKNPTIELKIQRNNNYRLIINHTESPRK